VKKIVLISCASKKLNHKAKAKDLYIGPLFKLSLEYARLLKPDYIFILSAKHGLVDLEKELEPYNLTLNTMKANQIKIWAESVLEQLKSKVDLKSDDVIFLAGNKYRKYLIPFILHYQIPLRGLKIGKQLQYLKRGINDAK